MMFRCGGDSKSLGPKGLGFEFLFGAQPDLEAAVCLSVANRSVRFGKVKS